ncbi:MAG: MoaD/ThiS family protein [Candidatus Helarchaeota archaeon]
MEILIKLFGDLRKKISENNVCGGAPLYLEMTLNKTKPISEILSHLKIDPTEISHIFVNGRYSGLNKYVKDRDIIAFFPRNMGLLYKWYFSKEED